MIDREARCDPSPWDRKESDTTEVTCTQSHFHKVISFEEAIKGASIYHSCVSLAEHKTLYMYCVTSSASQSDGVKITPPFYRCKKRGSDLLKASQ